MAANTTVTVRLGHHSSIPHARWCEPVGWEPTNEIEGSELMDGSWWNDHNTAGLVCFAEIGSEGDIVEVDLDELRVASCGNCRVIGPVEL